MWIETKDSSIIDANTFMKIEVKHHNEAKVSPRAKLRHFVEVNMDIMSPEKQGKNRDRVDKYEIRVWMANGSDDPYILFEGTKNECESEYTKLKSKLLNQVS